MFSCKEIYKIWKPTPDDSKATVLIILEALQSLLQNTLIMGKPCPPINGPVLKR